jgi:exosortase
MAWPLSVLAFSLLLAYSDMLSDTAHMFASSDDMAHGFFAPFVAGYAAWMQRRNLHLKDGSAWGLLLMGPSALLGIVSVISGSSTVARVSFLGSLAGCVVIVVGFNGLRHLIFPFFLMLFTFPIPQVLYGQITLPLQLIASAMSAGSLDLMGFSVSRQGNVLELPHSQLSIVEACSGLRSLVTLLFFAIVYAYFFERSWRMRIGVILSAVPVAIVLNSLRISISGVLAETYPRYMHGFYHSLLGWAVLLAGFVAIFLAHRGLCVASRRIAAV